MVTPVQRHLDCGVHRRPDRPTHFPLRLAILAALLVFPLLLCPWGGIVRAADSAPVRVAGADYLGDMPTVIAEQEGLFERQGLKVNVALHHTGSKNLGLLRAGEADFALMALTPIVLDRLADPSPGGPDDPVILASLVHSTRLNHVVASASGPVETPSDLVGRRVALRKGTKAEFVWWLFAHFNGFSPDAAELVDYPVTRIADALQDGEVDAAVLWEPWLSRLNESGGKTFRSFPGSNVHTAKWVLVTTRAAALEHPGRSEAVLAAYRDAIALIDRAPEAAIATYARRADIAEDVLRRNWPKLDYQLNLEWSVLATLQQQMDWAMRTGRRRASQSGGVLDLIDATALRSLDPAAVGIPEDPADREVRP